MWRSIEKVVVKGPSRGIDTGIVRDLTTNAVASLQPARLGALRERPLLTV